MRADHERLSTDTIKAETHIHTHTHTHTHTQTHTDIHTHLRTHIMSLVKRCLRGWNDWGDYGRQPHTWWRSTPSAIEITGIEIKRDWEHMCWAFIALTHTNGSLAFFIKPSCGENPVAVALRGNFIDGLSQWVWGQCWKLLFRRAMPFEKKSGIYTRSEIVSPKSPVNTTKVPSNPHKM